MNLPPRLPTNDERVCSSEPSMKPPRLALRPSNGDFLQPPHLVCHRPKNSEPGIGGSSKVIPLPKTHIRRTISEEDVQEMSAAGAIHDAHMFTRLIRGIEQKHKASSAGARSSVDHYLAGVRYSKTIDSIVRTHNASFTELDNILPPSLTNRESPLVHADYTYINGASSSREPDLLDILQMAYEVSRETLPSTNSSDPNQHHSEEGIFVMDDL
jgi:hypothetical protein